MARLPYPLLAVAVAAMVAACSGSAAPSSSPASVNGHTYLSTALQGTILVPGTQVRVSFADGQLSANGGCNTMGGTYTIDGDRITTTQTFQTAMGCDEPRQKQDEWLARFLTDVRFTLAGDTLTLTDVIATLTLVDKEVATPDQPLGGTRWVLDGIVSGDAVSSVPVGVTATIQIDGDRVNVEAGCNRGGGTVTVAADKMTFGPIALTKMACEAGAMAVETAVITVLSGDVAYTIDADTLTIDGGGSGLVFRAAS
jgi:heat shock protein HslJ